MAKAVTDTKQKQKKDDVGSPPLGMMHVTSIVLEPLENASVFYVNYIEVTHTAQDFGLICGRLPSKLSQHKRLELEQNGALNVEPDVQLVVPTTLVPALIRALVTQKEAYEKLYGIEIKEVVS